MCWDCLFFKWDCCDVKEEKKEKKEVKLNVTFLEKLFIITLVLPPRPPRHLKKKASVVLTHFPRGCLSVCLLMDSPCWKVWQNGFFSVVKHLNLIFAFHIRSTLDNDNIPALNINIIQLELSVQTEPTTSLIEKACCQGASSENKAKNGRANVELGLHRVGFQSNWDHTPHVQFWHIR